MKRRMKHTETPTRAPRTSYVFVFHVTCSMLRVYWSYKICVWWCRYVPEQRKMMSLCWSCYMCQQWRYQRNATPQCWAAPRWSGIFPSDGAACDCLANIKENGVWPARPVCVWPIFLVKFCNVCNVCILKIFRTRIGPEWARCAGGHKQLTVPNLVLMKWTGSSISWYYSDRHTAASHNKLFNYNLNQLDDKLPSTSVNINISSWDSVGLQVSSDPSPVPGLEGNNLSHSHSVMHCGYRGVMENKMDCFLNKQDINNTNLPFHQPGTVSSYESNSCTVTECSVRLLRSFKGTSLRQHITA